MAVTIRPLADADEVNAAFRVFLRAMLGLPFRDIDATEITEDGRYLGAFDDDRIVGGADSYGGWLTVPGGVRVPHAAVTHVGVLPTHRRQGILRELMRNQLRDIARRGEVVASLRASEAGIYGRFGYGIATSAQSARVDLRVVRPRDERAPGVIRLVDHAATTALLDDIYRRSTGVGTIHRPAGWWRLRELMRTGDPTTHFVAVHSTDDIDDGYAIYHPRDTDRWFTSREKTVAVTDLVALNGTARAALRQHLLSLDLVDVVEFEALALDDPLPLAVQDRRAVELGPPHDETWLRIVDVDRALSARSYRDTDPVVVEVRDDLLPENNGTYQVGPKSARRTSGHADVSVDVAALAAAYLSGTRWWQLDAAGRIRTHTPDAVRRLDELFGTDALPFSGTIF